MNDLHKKTTKQLGDDLEQMVAKIEKSLLDKSFSVEVGKRIYDEESNMQIAEVDISIKGFVGSVPLWTDIECRNRPSNGPQGRSWIRELKGKKDDINCDIMIAVSSTGFTETAKQLAKEKNIILREVVELKDISGDYDITEMGLLEFGVEVESLQVAPGTSPKILKNGKEENFPDKEITSLKKMLIRFGGQNNFIDFPGEMLPYFKKNHSEWYEKLDKETEETLNFSMDNVELFLQGKKTVKLNKLEATLLFIRKRRSGKIYRVLTYSDSKTAKGYYGFYEATVNKVTHLVEIFVPFEEDGSEMLPRILSHKQVR